MPDESGSVAAYRWGLRIYAILLIASPVVSDFLVGVCFGLALGVALDQFVLLPLARIIAARAARGERR